MTFATELHFEYYVILNTRPTCSSHLYLSQGQSHRTHIEAINYHHENIKTRLHASRNDEN